MAFEKKIEAKKGNKTCWIHKFDSLSEFLEYINTQEVNKVFKNRKLDSEEIDYYGNWHGTKDMDEAKDLLKNGWSAKAKELTQKLKVDEASSGKAVRPKQIKSVAGFHPIVPNYLAGNPQSMVSTKMVPKKQKVVNLVRQGNFLGYVSADEMQKEALDSLRIIKKVEAQGYRVNLFLAFVSIEPNGNEATMLVVKLKGANERLNISKLAFPLVNPAMFRRFVFRWKEVYDHTPYGFGSGYGKTLPLSSFVSIFGDQGVFPKGSYGINNFVGFDVDKMKGFDQLVKLS